MPEIDWLFRVFSPTGGVPRDIGRDDTTVRSTGLRMQITPEGDGREASWDARGSNSNAAGQLDRPNWGIPVLSAVQVLKRVDGVAVPHYYGQVMQGGNPRDLRGENYKLVSLVHRLKHVMLSRDFTAPQQAAHLTVRAILADVESQLDGLVLVDPARIVDLGFDAAPVVASNQQNAYALLEQLQEDGNGMGVKVRFGVAPNRTFYCRPALSDVLVLNELTDLKRVDWKPPDAVDTCTAVLWFLAQRADQSWLTHLSVSPERNTYGQWIKALTVQGDVLRWRLGTFTVTATDDAGHVSTDTPEMIGALTDDPSTRLKSKAGYLTLTVNAETDSGTVSIIVTLTEDAEFLELAGLWDGGDISQNRLEIQRPGKALETWSARDLAAQQYMNHDPNPEAISMAALVPPFRRTLEALPSGTVIRFIGVSLPTAAVGYRRVFVRAFEARPEVPMFDLLDAAAQHHYKTPTQAPGEFEMLSPPLPADLKGRIRVGDYEENVEAYEYRLSASGWTCAVQTGSPDDPTRAAQQELIKRTAQTATIRALTAQT